MSAPGRMGRQHALRTSAQPNALAKTSRFVPDIPLVSPSAVARPEEQRKGNDAAIYFSA